MSRRISAKTIRRRIAFFVFLLCGFRSVPCFDPTVDDLSLRVSLFSLVKPGEIGVESLGPELRAAGQNEERECRRLAVHMSKDHRLAVLFDGSERRIWDALSLQTETADGLFLVRVPSQPERTYSGRLEIAPGADGLRITIILPLREYLYGVVGSEMKGESEALKAQAILSRTYAIFNRGRHHREGFDFCDTTHCQYFTGRARATIPIRQAVDDTFPQVLSGPDGMCSVFFHSTCGGRTNEAGDIYPCLRGIDDGDNCSASPHFRWQVQISREKWKSLVKAIAPGRTSEPLHFRVVHSAPGGWVRTVSIAFSDGSSLHLSGEKFHLALGRRLGWNVFKSANFTVAKKGDGWMFSGKGFGHGLGLCQWGAKRLAAQGWDCGRILRHYFPMAEIRPYAGPFID